jgi:hypothetical protein
LEMPTRRFNFSSFVIVVFLLPAALTAQQVMYSSLGPGGTFAMSGPSTICSAICEPGFPAVADANAFTANGITLTGQFDLTQIDVAMGPGAPNQGGTVTKPFIVQIAADAGGIPGTVLETWNVNTPSPTAMLYTLKDSLNVKLIAGQQYWVIVEPGMGIVVDGWYQHLGASPIPFAQNLGLGSWHTAPATSPNYFDVLANGEDVTPPPPGPTFGQYVHFVAGPINPPIGGPVELTLGFVDLNGNPVGPTITSAPLSAGQFASLDLGADALGITRPGQRVEVRPVVTAQSASGAPAAAAILASSEVVDRLTGIGTFVARDPRLVGLLSVSPVFAPMVLAGGETLRLVAVAKNPGPQGLPGAAGGTDPGPTNCSATLAFADINGNPIGPNLPVNLNPGLSAFLDLPSQALGLTTGQRTDVQPMVIGPSQNQTCSATVEVFDQVSGRTHAFQSAQPAN